MQVKRRLSKPNSLLQGIRRNELQTGLNKTLREFSQKLSLAITIVCVEKGNGIIRNQQCIDTSLRDLTITKGQHNTRL